MKRQTLETAIRLHLKSVSAPANATFNVIAHSLWADGEGGWSTNDSWYMSRSVDLETLLEDCRGRWEVFKVNYAPKARVADLADIGYEPSRICLECAQVPFLNIEIVEA